MPAQPDPAVPIHPFTGVLAEGKWYRALVVQEADGTIRLTTRLWVPAHHAGFIEWTNLGAQPPVTAARERSVVFRVVSREIVKVGDADRWHSNYVCEIWRLD